MKIRNTKNGPTSKNTGTTNNSWAKQYKENAILIEKEDK